MQDCIFCGIAVWEIACYQIWENEEFIALFDLYPSGPGQTLVMPKKQYSSDIFGVEEEGFYERLMQAGKTVAKLLKKTFKVERVALVVEGLMVDHLHLRLYPLNPGMGLQIDGRKKAKPSDLKRWQKIVAEGGSI